MIVMKFGGSSIADSERMKNVARIITGSLKKRPFVVISGIGGITDDLIAIGKAAASGKSYAKMCGGVRKRHTDMLDGLGLDVSLLDEEMLLLKTLPEDMRKDGTLKKEKLDLLMSLGERMSVKMLACYMSKRGQAAVSCNSYDIGLLTDSNFGNADVLPETYARIRKSCGSMKALPVITGFIGKDRLGNITTLGRGGSDYTACIVGAAMGAENIQIWTNVDGVMTADPRVVPSARSISELTFDEEAELEFLGAATLHPKGIRPAMEKNINVRIMNTLNPGYKGTMIKKEIGISRRVASITSKKGMTLFEIISEKNMRQGSDLGSLISEMGKHGTAFDFVSVSRKGVMAATTTAEDNPEALIKGIAIKSIIKNHGKIAKVSVVGKNITGIDNVPSRIIGALGKTRIIALEAGISETSYSVILDERNADSATALLHDEFFGRSG